MRLTPEALSPREVVAVARDREAVEVDRSVHGAMAPARAVVEAAVASEEVVYGVTTGFGALADTVVPAEDAAALQHALVRSHAAGMGALVDDEVVRAMTLLRARTLAAGYSGARVEVVEMLAALLNAGVRVAVPEHGSLGASGDLAPMAHVALALTGEGWAVADDGTVVEAAPVLAAAGVEPLALDVKDGLALLNATEGMLAHLVLALEDLTVLADTADVVCALSVEALLATDRPFAPELQALRPHPGQAVAAENLRTLLAGSPVLASHRHSRHAVQDAYSLRCAPQVHGAARDTMAWSATVRDRELASVVDNPVVLPNPGGGAGGDEQPGRGGADGAGLGRPGVPVSGIPGRVESTGNFHGAPLGFAMDLLAIGTAELGTISERRTDRLLDPARNHGLAPFLAPEAGINSGFMIAQYTAASLVAENRRLAVPASVDSVPTSGMQEDHVSMGWSAGCKLRRAVANLGRVLAVEALCAAAGVEQRCAKTPGLKPGERTAAVIARLRGDVPEMPRDRFLAPDLAAAETLVRTGALADAAGL